MLSSSELIYALKRDFGDPGRLSIIPRPNSDDIRERGATSIDLRLGRWFRSFKQSDISFVDVSGKDRGSRISRSKEHFVPNGSPFVLHPGRFVLGITLEWISLGRGLSGYVTGKSSLGRQGLVIETAAGIHPNFSGCLALELANVGEVPLQVSPGMPICQIFIHRIEDSRVENRGKFSGRRKPALPIPEAEDTFLQLDEKYPND